jgi:heterodisulfide reductase subunit A
MSVDIVEKTDTLGGNLKDIYSTLEHDDAQGFLKGKIKELNQNDKITIHLNSSVLSVSGCVGNFKATIAKLENKDKMLNTEYGAIILATGATQYEPKAKEFMHGESSKVWTQLELEAALAGKALDDKEKMNAFKKLPKDAKIAMIQCVGSRNSEHPYCSRVCCAKAIKNAQKLRKEYPDNKIYIIYQDIMTYGLQEKYYLEARKAGIEFLRYEPDIPPEVVLKKSGDLQLQLKDPLLNQKVSIEPYLIILSTGIVPDNNGLEIFDELGVEYTDTNFLKEANVKFRPVDILTDGIFIAGLAHSPRQLGESMIQGQAAAGRAMTILNKKSIPIRREVSIVNTRKCSGCESCVLACPYHARIMDEEEKIAVVLEPLCQACGACAMVCPNAAAILPSLKRGQVYSMIDAAVFS